MPRRRARAKPPPSIAVLHKFPIGIRVGLWLWVGKLLRLPIEDLFTSLNINLEAAKRRPGRLPLTVSERLRLARIASRLGQPFHDLFAWIVSPDSLVRWLKRYQQRAANSAAKPRGPGRPWLSAEKTEAILQIYDSGRTGTKRIVGEMKKLGLDVAKSTVRKVLTRNGRPPTDGKRRLGGTWGDFWKRHAAHTVGVDFIQMPVGLLNRIANAFVLVAIEHDTRRVHLLGITFNPTDAWIANVLRSATMLGAPLSSRQHWILDNDGKYGPQTDAVLGDRLVHTAVRAPDMNAFIERWIRSIKEECLNHSIYLSEAMLREHVETYIAHYNAERPHQGIGNRPVGPWESKAEGRIVCDQRLHGLLTSFRRAA